MHKILDFEQIFKTIDLQYIFNKRRISLSKIMKILIPVWGFGRAGGDRVLSQLANYWIKAGHSVSFITSQYSMAPYFPTNADIIWINQSGGRVSDRSLKRPKKPGLIMLCSLFGGLRRYSADFDVVLANQSLTAWPVVIAARSKKRFYYVQAYEPEYYLEERGLKHVLPYLFSSMSYWLPLIKIANSPLYVEDKKVNARNFIPPGIDLDVFYPKANDPTAFKDAGKVVIGCIGRREPPKGIKYLIEAYEGLGTEYDLKVAYGNLPDLDGKKRKCRVVVPNNDAELADFYRSVDLLIAPGTVQHGAYHYPVMEAIACGTPVLHTGYLPGNDMNSWLCKPKSPHSIKKEIEAFAASDKSTIRAKVRSGLQDISNLSWTQVSERFIRLFNET